MLGRHLYSNYVGGGAKLSNWDANSYSLDPCRLTAEEQACAVFMQVAHVGFDFGVGVQVSACCDSAELCSCSEVEWIISPDPV